MLMIYKNTCSIRIYRKISINQSAIILNTKREYTFGVRNRSFVFGSKVK